MYESGLYVLALVSLKSGAEGWRGSGEFRGGPKGITGSLGVAEVKGGKVRGSRR